MPLAVATPWKTPDNLSQNEEEKRRIKLSHITSPMNASARNSLQAFNSLCPFLSQHDSAYVHNAESKFFPVWCGRT